MNWDDPSERAALIERVGPAEYEKRQAANRAASVMTTIAGHEIRPVSTRFGRLLAVGDTGQAFSTLDNAQRYAIANPRVQS